jgi:hypothetical protein
MNEGRKKSSEGGVEGVKQRKGESEEVSMN